MVPGVLLSTAFRFLFCHIILRAVYYFNIPKKNGSLFLELSSDFLSILLRLAPGLFRHVKVKNEMISLSLSKFFLLTKADLGQVYILRQVLKFCNF